MYPKKRKDKVSVRNPEHLYSFSIFLSNHAVLCTVHEQLIQRWAGSYSCLLHSCLWGNRHHLINNVTWGLKLRWSLDGYHFLANRLQFSHTCILASIRRSLSWIYSSDTICIAWFCTRLQPLPSSFTARVQLWIFYTFPEDDFVH